jgi:hypothetical protein
LIIPSKKDDQAGGFGFEDLIYSVPISWELLINMNCFIFGSLLIT